jgi:hypothetical protein
MVDEDVTPSGCRVLGAAFVFSSAFGDAPHGASPFARAEAAPNREPRTTSIELRSPKPEARTPERRTPN